LSHEIGELGDFSDGFNVLYVWFVWVEFDALDRAPKKWLGLFEQLFPKDKWIGSRMSVLGKAHES